MKIENHKNDFADIIKEFNTIVESANDKSKFNHDRYFRFAFADTERVAELLNLFAKRRPSLRAFLDTIDISSLRGVSENYSAAKHTGSADLVFEADIKGFGGKTGLYVGIVAEHKSTNKDDVIRQLSEYHHHLFMEYNKNIPVVAFIVYNGKEDWNPLGTPHFANYPKYYHDIGYPFKVEFLDVGHDVSDEDLRGLSPMTLVALTAMKYIWNAEQFSVSFKESAVRLLKMQNTDTGREFIRQSLYYFFWKWPYKENSEVIKMDSPEAVANKGYESFAEHFISVGEDKAISVLQNMGLSDEQIAEFKAKFAALK